MSNVEFISQYGHEEVAFFNNEKAGLHCIIGIHNTKLGPALGGCRLYPYASLDDALFDVLRLSRGMSFKNAAAGLPIGGGKGVIIARPDQKCQDLFEAYGEAVESLQGRYLTAEDVNTTVQDMSWVMNKTKHVVGQDGVRAIAKFLFGSDDLKDVKICLQGLGHVGFDVCRQLHELGADLTVSTHSNRANMKVAVAEWGAKEVSDEELYRTPCDILVPCALGATLNYTTIPELKCKAVGGAANNQLLDDECGNLLKARGIAYAPDFIINGGGVINAGQEAFTTYNRENVLKQVHNIYNTVLNILEESKASGEPEGVIAQRFAEERIKNGL